ncbi:hypothetical protein KKF91_08930 [Myxococcota bacterium]|nr:hypothetical protein [Myxococcota bacterium]
MINNKPWENIKTQFPINSKVEGYVIHVASFGVFVKIDNCQANAVLLVTEFEDGERSFDIPEYPQIGALIQAIVVDHIDHNKQLRLSTCRSKLKLAD